MEIKILDSKHFIFNGKTYNRKCYLIKKKNKKYNIRYFFTNEIIADDISLPKNMSAEELRLLIFNRKCLCCKIDNETRIFDLTFDNTFE